MKANNTAHVLVVAALLLIGAEHVEAQLAKQGTYSGSYGWSASSTVHQLDEGHVYTQDIYEGTFFNDAGEGFLHESSWVCFGISDTRDGNGDAKGYCVVTDKHKDKVFLVWQGTVDPETGFNGDFNWTGGTGKYAGIEGNSTFRAIFIGSTPQGRGLFKGKWQLP